MNRITFILILCACILTGCTKEYDTLTESEEMLIEQAKENFREATRLTNKRENWMALGKLNEAEKLYVKVNHESEMFNKYLLQRQKALLLSRVKLYGLASESMADAMALLELTEDAGVKTRKVRRKGIVVDEVIEYPKERVSTLEYTGRYLMRDYDFEASNEIFFDILEKDEVVKHLHARIKNYIGRNYYELRSFDKAFEMFDDILKISDLPDNLKAHYLHSRSMAASQLGQHELAINDMHESIDLFDKAGKPLYQYVARMGLGEVLINDKQFEEANSILDEALGRFDEIHQDPDLFEIYNHKHLTSSVLNLENSSFYKRKYDSLAMAHQEATYRFTSSQQELVLSSKLASIGFKMIEQRHQRINTIYIYSAIALAILFGVTLIWLISYLRKRGRIGAITGG